MCEKTSLFNPKDDKKIIYDNYHYYKKEEIINIANKILIAINELNTTISKEFILEYEALNSSAIEGYYSTILSVHDKNINDESTRKVRANIDALKIAIYSDKQITKHLILMLNSLFQEKEIKNYRKEPVYVVDSRTQKTVHVGYKHEDLEVAMQKYISYYNNNNDKLSQVDLLIKSTVLHYIFVDIHPFEDGNGRTTRSLQFKFLIDNLSRNFSKFSISYVGKNKISEYYKSLEEVEKNNYDLTNFIQTDLTIIFLGIKRIYILSEMTRLRNTCRILQNIILNLIITDVSDNITLASYKTFNKLLKKLPDTFLKSQDVIPNVSYNKLIKILRITPNDFNQCLSNCSAYITSLNLVWQHDRVYLNLPKILRK